ncbi:uncharacterized protein BJX67DRAFT_383626 [Aspergillus lucknowensis]|uniref:Uncharacterized protein n=1 Tax=Aspergillus lucknowensis TaxID=176173 RepID=A0ABR4LJ60_9EURO
MSIPQNLPAQIASAGSSAVQKALTEGPKLATVYGKPAVEKSLDVVGQAANWSATNPLTVASLVVGGVMVAAPGVVAGPVLGAVGFGAGGVQAGSVAACIHSVIGNPVAGGAFATLQSAGAGGVGVAVVNGMMQAGGAAIGIGRAGFGLARAMLPETLARVTNMAYEC